MIVRNYGKSPLQQCKKNAITRGINIKVTLVESTSARIYFLRNVIYINIFNIYIYIYI